MSFGCGGSSSSGRRIPSRSGDRRPHELQQVLPDLVTNEVHAVGGSRRSSEGHRAGHRPERWSRDTSGARHRFRRAAGAGAHLLTPFFTTKGPGQGTGLGLSVSYGLGKRTMVASATAWRRREAPNLRLAAPPHYPCPFCRMRGSSRSRTAQPALSAADVGAPSRQSRVLVVDDDTAVHRLVSALFAPEGYAVDTARNGEQALRMVEDWVYDLVITDADAVSADGRFFAATLLSSWPDWRDRLVVASHGRASEPFVTAAETGYQSRSTCATSGRSSRASSRLKFPWGRRIVTGRQLNGSSARFSSSWAGPFTRCFALGTPFPAETPGPPESRSPGSGRWMPRAPTRAPASSACARCSRFPAPPDAMTGMRTAAAAARSRGRS